MQYFRRYVVVFNLNLTNGDIMKKLKTILFSALLAFGMTSFANACGKLVIAEQNCASAEIMANVD